MRLPIGVNLAPQGIDLEEHHDFAGDLNKLKGKGVHVNARHAGRKTFAQHRVIRFLQRIFMRSEG